MADNSWQKVLESLNKQIQVGIDDMTLLHVVDDHSIADNLKVRLAKELIYTCIGRVLIAVNPFKRLDIYDQRYIYVYHHYTASKKPKKDSKSLSRGNRLKCSTAKLTDSVVCEEETAKDLPPHIYALTDNMYGNMMMERENQCVIISGESGAGKTVSAKYIMNYLAEIAGQGSKKIEEVKNIITQSNPLLEAFGNAKTLRNNNSSRFGKFVEILFNMAGQPDGGKVSNFLLEKSRVVTQNHGERNYHVFYQLLKGCTPEQQEKLELQETDPSKYYYLNRTGGCYEVPDADDSEEFKLMMNAMDVIGLDEDVQLNVLQIISGILHLGNVQFIEDNNVASVEEPSTLVKPAKLLAIDSESLKEKLVSRVMESRWGGKVDVTMLTLNMEQAQVSRDALAKALYAQLFDLLVTLVNKAMRKDKIGLCIGVLDIYGFEIFETNGFEQFCINYVNEKLQQIFVELTLKKEQEEYLEEGITWSPVKFFNNKLVCDLIESKQPPGIMSVLDDVCQTVHAAEGSDRTLMEKLKAVVGSESTYSKNFRGLSTHFEVHHYAGKVHYETKHFCERNKDVLFDDVIQLMQKSENEFIKNLFIDMPISSGKRGRASTGSSKIKSQCQDLIDRIMACTPHYVRCLKPSESKKPLDWCDQRILPQISYLGLRENIDVRRAGFAFRRTFGKIIEKYDVIVPKSVREELGDDQAKLCEAIMSEVQFGEETWKIGYTKVFMKNSDMISKLEEARAMALFRYAAKLQSIVRGFLARQYCKRLRQMIRAAKIIQRAIRYSWNKKRLHRRLLVKQHLKDVILELEGEAAASNGTEMCDEELDVPVLRFTHQETTDHINYYENNDIQKLTGSFSIFFACKARVFTKTNKMESCFVVIAMHHIFLIEHSATKGRKYEVKSKYCYNDIKDLSVSILDTEFLILSTEHCHIILESPHKDSLAALIIAASCAMNNVDKPQLQRTDLLTIKIDSGKEVCLKFLKEGRAKYKEPRVSKSGNEITVTLPDPNCPVEETASEEEAMDSDAVEIDDDVKSLTSTKGSHLATSSYDKPLSLNIELGNSGGKISFQGIEVLIKPSDSSKQTVDFNIFYHPPNPLCLESNELLVSPFIIISNMIESQTELELTLPFLSNLPEDIDNMAKWIRFYSALSDNTQPEWQDIRSLEDLSAFMVEIYRDYAKLYTQENVIFCILGSRELTEEEVAIYGEGQVLDYSMYGEYGEYGEYYGDNTGEYSNEETATTVKRENNTEIAQMLNAVFDSPMDTCTTSSPPPLPNSEPPPRPFPSPFQGVPLLEDDKVKTKKEKKQKKDKKDKKDKKERKEKKDKKKS